MLGLGKGEVEEMKLWLGAGGLAKRRGCLLAKLSPGNPQVIMGDSGGRQFRGCNQMTLFRARGDELNGKGDGLKRSSSQDSHGAEGSDLCIS